MKRFSFDISGPTKGGVGKRMQLQERTKVAFVTHFCPHYRIKTFEMLARDLDVQYLFYSSGNEWYGQGLTGIWRGAFEHKYLRGFQITGRTRIAPSLLTELWRGNYDVIVKCINGKFALPVSYLIARLKGKPFVLWTGIWMTLRTPVHRMAFPITRWIYTHADSIAVYGKHVKDYLVQQGVRSEKIFIAAHAVDNAAYSQPISEQEKARVRREFRIDGCRVVLYLGRIEKEKGLEYLAEAFARLRVDNAVLLCVGTGSRLSELKGLLRDLGVEERTRFVGFVPAGETLPYYAIADLCVLPSVTVSSGREPWGLVVNEAMNQGVPVVVTTAVGAAAGGLVKSGSTGFVVPERDSTALAEAIEQILSNDDLRQEMSRNARKEISAWDNETMVKGFQQAIEFAISSKINRKKTRCNAAVQP